MMLGLIAVSRTLWGHAWPFDSTLPKEADVNPANVFTGNGAVTWSWNL